MALEIREGVESWCHDDHIRHYMYQSIANCLCSLVWDKPKYEVIDFGSEWFGDPDGGWQTFVRWILKKAVGVDRINHKLALYPEYDICRLSISSNTVDIMVVDQVLEHVETPWLAAQEIRRVLAPGGIAIVATPGLYPIHPSPLDCWRIMPDGYRVLFPEWAWQTLVLDMWGNRERVGYEYLHNGGFPYGMPDTKVVDAVKQPYYTEGNDARCPLQIWWIGKKR